MKRSTITKTAGILAATAASLVLAAGPIHAQATASIEIEISPSRIDTQLGSTFDIEVRVSNRGTESSPPLVAHIDITDPTQASSVDPEDWTATLSQVAGVIPPGESRSLRWSLQPISGGSYALYAVALAPGQAEAYASNVVAVDVLSNRPLNSEGVLPAVIAVPVVLGGLLGLVLRRSGVGRRQRTNRPSAR